ncbi:hypothetical protein BJ138DRAFT_1106823 [Hygrophoropsis aurantiaca]|uniref:Uncharacterized protein n=1 Tax=Hygrophoropsis aurantiaca TaxID=72124 RepID=A0ACB7ZU25_9AGAM|nr:hypothetical protein BJ138DRAFT_1106823 [Hygrophoropsis aurantiaca]
MTRLSGRRDGDAVRTTKERDRAGDKVAMPCGRQHGDAVRTNADDAVRTNVDDELATNAQTPCGRRANDHEKPGRRGKCTPGELSTPKTHPRQLRAYNKWMHQPGPKYKRYAPPCKHTRNEDNDGATRPDEATRSADETVRMSKDDETEWTTRRRDGNTVRTTKERDRAGDQVAMPCGRQDGDAVRTNADDELATNAQTPCGRRANDTRNLGDEASAPWASPAHPRRGDKLSTPKTHPRQRWQAPGEPSTPWAGRPHSRWGNRTPDEATTPQTKQPHSRQANYAGSTTQTRRSVYPELYRQPLSCTVLLSAVTALTRPEPSCNAAPRDLLMEYLQDLQAHVQLSVPGPTFCHFPDATALLDRVLPALRVSYVALFVLALCVDGVRRAVWLARTPRRHGLRWFAFEHDCTFRSNSPACAFNMKIAHPMEPVRPCKLGSSIKLRVFTDLEVSLRRRNGQTTVSVIGPGGDGQEEGPFTSVDTARVSNWPQPRVLTVIFEFRVKRKPDAYMHTHSPVYIYTPA